MKHVVKKELNMKDGLTVLANVNLINLFANPYPGRGFILGFDETGTSLIQIYWIMGRSPNSRNRVFCNNGGRLFTKPADPSKVKDPSLIIYDAMNETGNSYIVSNGAQTSTVANAIQAGKTTADGLEGWFYEPDEPNFTPRITGVCTLFEKPFPLASTHLQIFVLRKERWSDDCSRLYYDLAIPPNGYGYCVTTYSGDGNPLPSFDRDPYILPLKGDPESMMETFWQRLSPENMVSLAIKVVPLDMELAKNEGSRILIRNKYKEV